VVSEESDTARGEWVVFMGEIVWILPPDNRRFGEWTF